MKTLSKVLLSMMTALFIAVIPFSAQESTAEPESTAEVYPTLEVVEDRVAYYVPQLIAAYPHDTGSYTQGLLLHEGLFYESGGQYGESSLREVDPESGEILRMISVADEYFAEGLALVDDRLIQLTWQEETAFVYDRSTFELLDTFSYDTEGWGLCYDGESLWMSDGSANLYQRDPDTFQLLNTIPVTYFGEPQERLNELECMPDEAGDFVLANLYYGDNTQYFIVVIDKNTGTIVALIDARELPTAETLAPLANDERFNGIAYDTRDNSLWVTGKHWDTMYHIGLELVGYIEPPDDSE